MKIYKSAYDKIHASSYAEAVRQARREYHTIQKHTPRRLAYIRSRYFAKNKIFIGAFWDHLEQKTRPDKLRRVQLFKCALDVLRNSSNTPETMQDPHNPDIALHRFEALTNKGEHFYVQVKENKKTDRKDFMSVFPAK